jgi:hypothetical protein
MTIRLDSDQLDADGFAILPRRLTPAQCAEADCDAARRAL